MDTSSDENSASPSSEQQEFLADFPRGLPEDLKQELVKKKPSDVSKATQLLQDALDMERLQLLLPLFVERDRYLALLLLTARKQRELEEASARQKRQQLDTPAKKTTGSLGSSAPKKDATPSFLKRQTPGFLGRQMEPKAAPKPKEEAGTSQLRLFAGEVARAYNVFPNYLIIGAAKGLSRQCDTWGKGERQCSPMSTWCADCETEQDAAEGVRVNLSEPEALPPLDCPLLTVLMRKQDGRYVHLLLLQWLLQQLSAIDMLHIALTCSTCNEVVNLCLRKTLASLPFQAEAAVSDIEYWFNAIRFFFQAACQVLPLDRLKHHKATMLALKKAKETFIVTADGMQASAFVTLDRLTPDSIAFCDSATPMRHSADARRILDSAAKVSVSEISLGDFVAEYRLRARVKSDELAWTLASTNCDEDLASYLFLALLQSLKRAVERHSGTATFRRVEYLASLGCIVEHRLWLQLDLFWGYKSQHTRQRCLFFTLADHFRWAA
ncbi:hypothetical protein cyc_03042 [Cyclospora cayetanensis]|uniref:Uncharacterized protein n=1 Tax=Cyclospora cayetanensis TaxID=88456 RepID=A0A1D3D761_9EIME|nr:hypothetical protein cyc_03042 [Cyclospora cayetanensis]